MRQNIDDLSARPSCEMQLMTHFLQCVGSERKARASGNGLGAGPPGTCTCLDQNGSAPWWGGLPFTRGEASGRWQHERQVRRHRVFHRKLRIRDSITMTNAACMLEWGSLRSRQEEANRGGAVFVPNVFSPV